MAVAAAAAHQREAEALSFPDLLETVAFDPWLLPTALLHQKSQEIFLAPSPVVVKLILPRIFPFEEN